MEKMTSTPATVVVRLLAAPRAIAPALRDPAARVSLS
jgi:hypothetical protein